MAYQSEAALEQQFIEQLNKQDYSTVSIPDYSRTNRVEKETKPFGIIICYRNLKKRTDDALTLFSKSHDTSGIVVPGYQYFVEKFNEMVMKLKEIALFPESVDTMQSEDDQKLFVVTFRELTKYLQSLQTFIEFIGPPKTKTSARTIPVPSLLMNIIKKFYTENPNNYFLTGKTKPTEPRTYRQFFTRFLKRNGLQKVKFHEIRHTFAVRAIEIPEFDIKSLSEILGHKNVSFTLNVYGSANLQQKIKCMNLLNDLL